MGTGGEFLFGVPKESFSRLNAVYDREITPRLKEGVFFDRQSFLLGHLDEGEDLVLPGDLTGDAEETGRRPGAAPPARRRLGRELRALGPPQDGRRPRPRQPLPEAGGARARVVPGRPAVRGRRGPGRRPRRPVLRLPVDPAPHLGLRGRDRARRPAGAALRVPHRDLLAHRPRRLPHLAARGREDARLPRLRARGERRGLLPPLRAGPLGGLLRDLPLPAEARLGLLPLLPHRDQIGVRRPRRRHPRPARRAACPFSNRRAGRRVQPDREEPCPCHSSRRAPATPR